MLFATAVPRNETLLYFWCAAQVNRVLENVMLGISVPATAAALVSWSPIVVLYPRIHTGIVAVPASPSVRLVAPLAYVPAFILIRVLWVAVPVLSTPPEAQSPRSAHAPPVLQLREPLLDV